MLVKTCPAKIKAVGDAGDGVFEAMVSVFGNKDSYGDVVIPGAFEKSLSEWRASGNPIPVYYSHRMDDPDYNIGWVLDAKEVAPSAAGPGGLWVKAQIDLADVTPTSKAPQTYRLMKSGRLAQFSFAYDIESAGMARSEELGDYFELRQLKIHEVGPTPLGANDQTVLLDIKSATATAQHLRAGLKAGRVLSAKNETALRTAYEAIGDVLAALDTDSEKASGNGQAKNEGAGGVKFEEPARIPSADQLAELEAIEQLLLLTA